MHLWLQGMPVQSKLLRSLRFVEGPTRAQKTEGRTESWWLKVLFPQNSLYMALFSNVKVNLSGTWQTLAELLGVILEHLHLVSRSRCLFKTWTFFRGSNPSYCTKAYGMQVQFDVLCRTTSMQLYNIFHWPPARIGSISSKWLRRNGVPLIGRTWIVPNISPMFLHKSLRYIAVEWYKYNLVAKRAPSMATMVRIVRVATHVTLHI